MANLTLELIINSASDLENVNHLTRMNVYAIITLGGDKTQKNQKMKTDVDHSGGSNPNWNHSTKFFVKEKLVLEGRVSLVVSLFSKRLLGDKDIGRVEVPLLDLLHSQTPPTNGNFQGMKFVSYQVKTQSKKMKGYLTLSYRFNGAPVITGQGYHQAQTLAPPSQQGYGPYGYIPPPPPPGYGYGGLTPQKPMRNEANIRDGDTFVSALSLLS
ncbi:Protein SRC2 [Cardamine amara subsp. amara]|uniref:Protein SRC2 n=1 Tax=Cardamine amara subsp. amara TaxID=228776 RepID=A0ABD1BTP4_CARAN